MVILDIADDDTSATVRRFAAEGSIPYPVLLDPTGKVSKLCSVEGIPMSFLYNR